MVVVIQYNILKIFMCTLIKLIKLILYFIVILLINERNLYKILRNTMLFHDYHIFRVNSNKKFSPYKFYERLILELLKIFQSFFIIVYIYMQD